MDGSAGHELFRRIFEGPRRASNVGGIMGVMDGWCSAGRKLLGRIVKGPRSASNVRGILYLGRRL